MHAALAAFASAVGGALPFALAIFLVALMFRRNLGALIDRVKSLKIAGQTAEMGEPQQQQVEHAEPELLPPPASGRAAPPPPNSPMFEVVERNIRSNLEGTAPNDPEMQLAWAIRIATNVTVDRDMEVTYRVIFGSQIAVLKEANMRGGSITVGRAEEIYEQAKARHPELYEAITFDAWAEFLITRGLATRPAEPITATSKSDLTEAGKQFLHFLTAKGLLEAKFG